MLAPGSGCGRRWREHGAQTPLGARMPCKAPRCGWLRLPVPPKVPDLVGLG